jgi:hypothetical protein
MKNVLFGCAVASLLIAPAAQAQDAAVFRPVGGWTADYGDEYCRLIRTFSNGSEEVSLAFERTQPGTPMRLILVGDGIKTFRGATEFGFAFTPGGNAAKSRVVRSETTDGKQYLNMDPVTLAASAFTPGAPPPPYNRDSEQETAAGITGLALDEGLADPVRFETGSLKAPIAALQACADDLLAVWGLDPAKHRTMTAAAILNPDSNGVLPQGTIPFGEFGKLNGGANQVRLMIGVDGKPTACTIYSPTLTETLNARICSTVMREATFQPAQDADGQPMASYWMGSPMFLGPPFRGGGR